MSNARRRGHEAPPITAVCHCAPPSVAAAHATEPVKTRQGAPRVRPVPAMTFREGCASGGQALCTSLCTPGWPRGTPAASEPLRRLRAVRAVHAWCLLHACLVPIACLVRAAWHQLGGRGGHARALSLVGCISFWARCVMQLFGTDSLISLMVMVITCECCGVQPTVSGQRCRVVLSDLCKVSVAAKSEAAAHSLTVGIV